MAEVDVVMPAALPGTALPYVREQQAPFEPCATQQQEGREREAAHVVPSKSLVSLPSQRQTGQVSIVSFFVRFDFFLFLKSSSFFFPIPLLCF